MLLEERPLAATATPAVADTSPDQPPARTGRGALLLAAAALLLAALSLLAPSAPTYDPWAWIVWGREITQLDLMTTDGPSWKPLPVLFTTPFALLGDAAPDLWLIVARAGYVVAVVMAFRLARRLGGGVPGGIAAAAALAAAPWFVRNAALGNSEPLLVGLLLGALDRHLDGDRRWAFGLGVACALLRPEVWPFLAVYGLWLMWRGHERPAVVVGAGIATLAVWTLPEWWGSGDPLRAMSRAQDPNPGAATFDENPALRIVSDAFAMLPWPAYAGLGLAAVVFALRRDRRLLALLCLAAGWLAIVAIMTADGGFSGNQRYLIPPVAVLIVLAGAGAGWLVTRLPARAAVAVAGVALAVLFAAPHFDRTRDALRTSEYQAELTDAIGPLVDRAGGADALLRCGRPYTGPFLVPHVAWKLGIHTTAVSLRPVRPAVVFRVRTVERARVVPSLAGVDDGGTLRTLATAPNWRVVAACDPAPAR